MSGAAEPDTITEVVDHAADTEFAGNLRDCPRVHTRHAGKRNLISRYASLIESGRPRLFAKRHIHRLGKASFPTADAVFAWGTPPIHKLINSARSPEVFGKERTVSRVADNNCGGSIAASGLVFSAGEASTDVGRDGYDAAAALNCCPQ